MDNYPQQQLINLVARYGNTLYNDPQRCEALLKDYCSQHRREVALLVNALKEQVPNEIISSAGRVPREVVRARLVKRLEENLCITGEAAAWAVDSWTKALGMEAETSDQNAAVQDQPLNQTRYEPAKLISGEPETEVVKRPLGESGSKSDSERQTSSKKYWLIGGIGAAVVAAIALISGMQYQQGWAKMKSALQETEKLQTDKKFSQCSEKAATIEGYDDLREKAEVVGNQCRLSLAKQFATDAKLSQAIVAAKKITDAKGDSSYGEAQDLIKNWSQGRWLKIENNCTHPLKLIIRYTDPADSSLKTEGWWNYNPQESSFLADSSNTRIRFLDPIFFYAETTNDANLEWAGKENVSFAGKDYKMRLMESTRIEAGNYVGTLICDKS